MKIQSPCLENIRWISLPSHVEKSGVLTSIESEVDTSFIIKRIFYMHHISSDRGGHAHFDTDQMIIAISGSFIVDLSDGVRKHTYHVDDPTKGLYVPRMIFIQLKQFSDNAVCLVLANTHYDIKKSIRSWEDYIEVIKNNRFYSK
jgi:hypothetical protein